MLETYEAEVMIREAMGQVATERVALERAAGRVLRQTIRAERDQPPYDRVTMDGVALRASLERHFDIAGIQRAGMAAEQLPAGAVCLEAMTGAMLPIGADMVVPIERLRRRDGGVTLEDGYTPEPGQFIHRKGVDCRAGDTLLTSGVRLNAPALAILAGNGFADVEVAQIQRIAIFSTGDELVPVGGPVREWQIRRSNEHAIAGALSARGFGSSDISWVADDLDATVQALSEALVSHDVLILSGGVSMGTYDHVPAAMQRLGVTKIFHRIAQRPGGPMWFGIGPKGQRVFGLPGNPVSALCCCVRYVVPALLEAQGLKRAERFTVILAAEAMLLPALTRFLPVTLRQTGAGHIAAAPAPIPTSGDYNHLGTADGFVELPPGAGHAPVGTPVVFHGW